MDKALLLPFLLTMLLELKFKELANIKIHRIQLSGGFLLLIVFIYKNINNDIVIG